MNFEKIYQEEHKNVLGFLIKKTNNVIEAEELANDVFIRVYKHLHNYDPEKSSIRTWVFNISNNILIDYYRKRKEKFLSINQSDSDGNNNVDYLLTNLKSSTPHMEMVTRETIMHAEKAIAKLPRNLRRISNLYFNHQYLMKDIAKKCDIPLNTVKGNILKARKILQKRLVNV